jgi:two-component system LytT family response regulator
MPGCDGFSALTHLPPPQPRVVFITAYPDYATRAFDIDATDYLLKPVSQERLLAAVERIRRDLAAKPDAADTPDPAIDLYPQRLSFVVGNRMRLIETQTIDHILVEANYIEVRSAEGCFVLRRPIGWIQARLDPARFLRIHRSHIVRIGAIAQVVAAPYGCYKLTLHNGEQLGSSRSYRDRIRAALRLGEV